MARSRVAVVIQSHRPALVGEALASAMAQTVPVQVIVQFDRENWGEKFNQAAAATTTEWLVPLCDDDRLAPTYVARCLDYADSGDIIFTDRTVWWEGLRVWYDPRTWFQRHTTPASGYRHMMFGESLVRHIGNDAAQVTIPPEVFAFGQPLPMTCMIRRTLWDDLQGYDGTLPHADTEFWYRAVKAGARIVYVPEPLFLYRYHPQQDSRLQSRMTDALVAFHRKHFLDFGFTFDRPVVSGTQWGIDVVPKEERASYQQAYLHPRSMSVSHV